MQVDEYATDAVSLDGLGNLIVLLAEAPSQTPHFACVSFIAPALIIVCRGWRHLLSDVENSVLDLDGFALVPAFQGMHPHGCVFDLGLEAIPIGEGQAITSTSESTSFTTASTGSSADYCRSQNVGTVCARNRINRIVGVDDLLTHVCRSRRHGSSFGGSSCGVTVHTDSHRSSARISTSSRTISSALPWSCVVGRPLVHARFVRYSRNNEGLLVLRARAECDN